MKPGRPLITSDFNIPVDKPEDFIAAKLLSILESFGLAQHVNVPTHVAGQILELVIKRENCALLACSPQVHYVISSHSTILFSLILTKPKCPKIVCTCRKTKSIDICQFRSESSLLLTSPIENMDGLARQYQTTLSSILDDHAPKVTVQVPKRELSPWYSSDIAAAKLIRRHLERRWQHTKLDTDRRLFIDARNVSCLLLNAKTSFYFARVQDLIGNQRALFYKMNHLLHKPAETPSPAHNLPEVLANQFAEFFSEKIEKIRGKNCAAVSNSHLQHILQTHAPAMMTYVNYPRSVMYLLKLF